MDLVSLDNLNFWCLLHFVYAEISVRQLCFYEVDTQLIVISEFW
jgi:hypothetical protein